MSRVFTALALASLSVQLPSVGAAQSEDPATGQTLTALLAYADRSSPELAVAEARLGEAEVARASADPLLPANPQIQAQIGQRRVGDQGDLDLQVGIRQQIEIGGQRRRRRTVANRSEERWSAEREVVRQDVHRRVRTAFRRTVVAEARVELAAALVAQQAHVVTVATRRAEIGEGSPMDAQLAAVEHLRARQAEVAAVAEARSRRWELGALIGWDRPEPPRPAATLDAPPALPPLARLLDHLDAQPRLVVARARAAEAEARELLARRDVLPDPIVGVQLTAEGAPAGGQREWVLAGTLQLPLPLWQRNQPARARATTDRSIAEAEARAWEQRLAPRVRQLTAMASGARDRAALVATELVPALDEATTKLDRAFELGEIDLLALLAARERLLRARVEVLDAHQAYVNAVAALETILGASLEDLR